MLRAVLPEQAEGRIEPDVEGDRRGAAGALVLRPGQEHRLAARHEDQQRLLEARVEAGRPGEIGEVLAVAIDDERRSPPPRRGSASRAKRAA